MREASLRVGAIFCMSLLSACATTPLAENMQVNDFVSGRSNASTLGVHVEGGRSLQGQLTNPQFEKAVANSILASKTFSDLVEIANAVYRLDVVLGDIRQPPGGLNMTTEMTVLWNLSRVDSQETIWQELVASSFTATVGDAFVGAARYRVSAEGAARDNIRQALESLAAADL